MLLRGRAGVRRRANERDRPRHALRARRIERRLDGREHRLGHEDEARVRMLDDVLHLRRLTQQIDRIDDQAAVHRRKNQPGGLDTVAHADRHDIARSQPGLSKAVREFATIVTQFGESERRGHVVGACAALRRRNQIRTRAERRRPRVDQLTHGGRRCRQHIERRTVEVIARGLPRNGACHRGRIHGGVHRPYLAK